VRVLNRYDFVETATGCVSTFEGIGKGELEVGVKDNPPAALLAEVLVFVFGVHVIFTEAAVGVVELWTID
jgi:hypothetical protein